MGSNTKSTTLRADRLHHHRWNYRHSPGEPDDSHHDQLRFYAMLAWLLTDEMPKSLSIFYTSSNRQVDARIPSITEMSQLSAQCRDEIAEIACQVGNGPPIANVSKENCGLCPVRQLCDPYWAASSTTLPKLSKNTLDEFPAGGRTWLDAELSELPPLNEAGGFSGAGVVAGLGSAQIRIDRSHMLESGITPSGARLLNATIEIQNGTCLVAATANTEVFWKA